MNKYLSKYCCYYPVTLGKGELVALYMNGYRRRQFIAPDCLKQWQQSHAIKLINYARKATVFHEKKLVNLSFGVDDFWSDFSKIPIMEKQELISSADMMMARGRLFSSSKTTGGSTGEPVTLRKNANALARERAATWRGYEWAGVGIGDRQGRFWGVPHRNKGSFEANLIDFFSNRKRISAFNLTEESLEKYHRMLLKFQPKYLYGYVSVLEVFANYIRDNNLGLIPSLVSIITTSEVLNPIARGTISSAFGVRVFNEYGCGELGSIAHECRHGSMHLMSDNLIVETLSGEATGELVATDLFNYAQPIIRYRLGDFATLSDDLCDCGVSLPCIDAIHGRAYDLLVIPSGKRVHPEAVIYLFEEMQKKERLFKQFQVIQKRHDFFVVNIIPTQQWRSEYKTLIVDLFRINIHPDIDVSINLVNSLSREKSGKLRVVKNEI